MQHPFTCRHPLKLDLNEVRTLTAGLFHFSPRCSYNNIHRGLSQVFVLSEIARSQQKRTRERLFTTDII